METDDILQIEKQHPDEWLLFEVYKTDKLGRPARGNLLAHSPSRAALYEFLHKIEVKLPYVTYSGQRPRKGMAAVL